MNVQNHLNVDVQSHLNALKNHLNVDVQNHLNTLSWCYSHWESHIINIGSNKAYFLASLVSGMQTRNRPQSGIITPECGGGSDCVPIWMGVSSSRSGMPLALRQPQYSFLAGRAESCSSGVGGSRVSLESPLCDVGGTASSRATASSSVKGKWCSLPPTEAVKVIDPGR